jgi:hypothetical protein
MTPCAASSKAAVVVFADGMGTTNAKYVRPDKPIVIETEGDEPSPKQIETLQAVYLTLVQKFSVKMSMFDASLLPFAELIRGE